MNRKLLFSACIGALALLGPIAAAAAQNVPDHYIVVLKSGASSADVANDHGLGVGHAYGHAINGFAGHVPPGRLRALQNDARVDWVEPDQVVTASAQTLPTGVNRIDGDLSSALSGNGSGSVDVDIAILDTGIAKSHPDLNVVGGKSFMGGNPNKWDDGNGHGSNVAGIAAARDNSIGVVGVAPGARLWAVKVLGNGGSGSSAGVIAGINWVKQNAGTIEVANMSLGGGFSQAENDAVNAAVASGVVFAVAAGNEGVNAGTTSPASAADAITVAALADSDGTPAGPDTFVSWSNYGTVVDVIAPGVGIYSTYKGSGYATLSGTSMASPHVAGAAALLRVSSPNPVADPVAVTAAVRTAILSAPGTEQIPGIHPNEEGDGFTYTLINVKTF